MNIVFNPFTGTFDLVGDGGSTGIGHIDTITPTLGQTSFACTLSPVGAVWVYVNGILYTLNEDYTQSFAVITWSNAKFSLDTSDEVNLAYVAAT